METKFNNATQNRPEGDRVLDAPYVLADLEKYSEQLMDEKAWDKNDRNGITVFKTEGQTIVLTAFQKGATAPDNMTKGTVTIQVLKGNISLEIGDVTAELKQAALAVIHEGKPYTLKANEKSLLLITTNLS